MKQIVPLCALVVFSMLAFLAHAAILEKQIKAIEIVHAPHFLFAGGDLKFEVRVRGAIDEDRQAYAMLCAKDWPCSLKPFEHEQMSGLSIEGSMATKLQPVLWKHVQAGEYLLIATLGANDQIRVSDALTVTVQGM